MRGSQRLLACLICFLLATAPLLYAAGELVSPWTCPGCGREGNTGLFCGYCGHSAPAGDEKEKPEKELYPTGEIKYAFSYDTAGRLIRRERYNRFGVMTSILENTRFDAADNPVEYTIQYLYDSGPHSLITYTAEYNAAGKETAHTSTLYGGLPGDSDKITYDAQNRVIGYTRYEPDGSVSGSNTDYRYDAEDHLIGYTALDRFGEVESIYTAEWRDGIRISYTNADPTGTIRSKIDLDSYGDIVQGQFWYFDGSGSVTSYTYAADGYTSVYRSFDSAGLSGNYISESRYSDRDLLVSSSFSYESKSYSSSGREEYKYDEKWRQYMTNGEETTNGESKSWRELNEFDEYDRIVRSTRYALDESETTVTAYFFDPNNNGHTQSESVHRSDGYARKTIYSYDNRWNETERTEEEVTAGGASTVSRTVKEYDARERVIRTVDYSNDEISHETEYLYTPGGDRLISRSIHYWSGSKTAETYRYDDLWRHSETETEQTDKEGTVTRSRETMEYDEYSRVIRKTTYREDNSIDSRYEYAFDPQGGEHTIYKFYSYGDSSSEATSEFNAEWLETVRHMKETSNKGEVSSYDIVFEYDTYGREVKKTEFYPDGTPHRITYTRYETDGTTQTKSDSYRQDGTLIWEGDWN